MNYRFSIEDVEATYPEIEPLYRAHYGEMRARLERDGIPVADYAPRLDRYFAAAKAGYLLTFILRTEDGEAIGYANLYLTNDMHNGELIVQEDTIFVRKDHRNGIGRTFSRFILDNLRSRGVKRLNVMAATDPRIVKLWKRMGFREVGAAMTFIF